jgi:hypothetical protein
MTVDQPMTTCPPPLEDAIRTELRGEAVLWSAAPAWRSYLRSRRSDLLGGIFFAAFTVFWISMAMGSGKNGGHAPWPFMAFGVGFLMVGLGQLFTALIATFGNRIFYVITGQRAIIFKKIWRLQIQSYEMAALGGFERVSFGGRAGDLIFQRIMRRGGKGNHVTEIGFFGLESFAEPEALLRDLVKQQAKLTTLP